MTTSTPCARFFSLVGGLTAAVLSLVACAAPADEEETGGAAESGLSQEAPAATGICAGKTVYVECYGRGMDGSCTAVADGMKSIRAELKAAGANVPPIEDVWFSRPTARRGTPQVFGDARVRGDAECAALVQASFAKWQATDPQRLGTTPPLLVTKANPILRLVPGDIYATW